MRTVFTSVAPVSGMTVDAHQLASRTDRLQRRPYFGRQPECALDALDLGQERHEPASCTVQLQVLQVLTALQVPSSLAITHADVTPAEKIFDQFCDLAAS